MRVPQLRPATAADEAFFRALYHSTRAEEARASGWPPAMVQAFLDSQFAAQQAGYAQSFPGAETFAVLLGADAPEPVGRIILYRSAHALRLVDFALSPSSRNQGLGTRLLAQLQQMARRAGCPLELQVERGSRALSLYLRAGFTRCGENALRVQMRWQPDDERAVDSPGLKSV